MKILKKLAAAAALAMAITTLAACGSDMPVQPAQQGNAPAGNDPVDAVNSITTELKEEQIRSQVTSASSTAKELVTTVNTWIADHVSAGGREAEVCELLINMNNGKATVTDSTGKNDWNAMKGCPESLEERFSTDYSARTFTAKVFIDRSGYACYAWFVPDNAAYTGDAPAVTDFEKGNYANWQSEDREGVTKDGTVVGTYPRLAKPSNSSAPSSQTGPLIPIAPAIKEQEIKSQVTSADITAKEMIMTVNCWIAEHVQAGGAEAEACELLINMNNGKATVTDSAGKNDWNGMKGSPDSLEQRFEADYSARTFTAKVFIDRSGYAVYAWCVHDDPAYTGDAPVLADFESGYYENWQPMGRDGVTKDGVIVGTYPKLRQVTL